MTIRLYNTKTRQKEDFVPINRDDVRMYVCGPTVYDRAHIGNARPVVVFDVLYRLLRHEYGEEAVTYVRNFTDVDDKINAKAAETGRSIREITDETIDWYHEDMDALGALRPTHAPRATEYIPQMIAMIKDLIARGHAYEAEGHVLFEARTDPEYGSLSRRPLDEMRAGARVEVAPYKRDPMDSVLWKPSGEGLPGWDSPWGYGRPGWHIECSAMAGDLLGPHFDIHGGGIDLQFPHHENECAQSRCVGHDFANVWMHNGYLMVEGEKMSKSLGNFFTVADLRAKGVPGEVMRLAMLMTHYRSPIDWTERDLSGAEIVHKRWSDHIDPNSPWTAEHDVDGNLEGFFAALSDDLNTPLAITEIHKMASASKWPAVKYMAGFLGLPLQRRKEPDFTDELKVILSKRVAARNQKRFEIADRIRTKLTDFGIEIEDRPEGTEWRIDYSTMRLAHAQRMMTGASFEVVEANWSEREMRSDLAEIISKLNLELEKMGIR